LFIVFIFYYGGGVGLGWGPVRIGRCKDCGYLMGWGAGGFVNIMDEDKD